MMKTINVKINSCTYPIYIGRGVLHQIPKIFKQLKISGNLLVVSQKKILALHGARLRSILKKSGVNLSIHIVPDGEQAKSEKELFRLYEAMLRARLDRSSHVLAFGGGVVGDLVGYAASTFKRGVGLIHVPTTLLAQVDSAIGGKTAINLNAGKNLVGTFYHPRVIISDIEILKTLPRKVISDALAEVVKYGMMSGPALLGWLEKNIHRALEKNIGILEEIVLESARIKVRVVEADPYELYGYRDILNYGHTFGHAFEAVAGYRRLTHGQAVACGMVAAGDLARRLGISNSSLSDRQLALIRSSELPTSLKGFGFKPKNIARYFLVDKKVRGGKVKFVLPQRIGSLLVVKGISPSLIEETLKQLV
ncbi:MAG: 3-dehydroquinate synthase [Candidatus Omnitrophica bacterium]|nr:3-dehydroquinate synthase [Candidatus Omnitrophota bacterium]